MSSAHGTETIVTPPDETIIWRYQCVYKFLDLVLTRELYFSRLDQLTDDAEGTLPEAVLQSDSYVRANADMIAETVRECVYVNCWHAREQEDDRMWEDYAGHGTGLAIRSTVGRFKAALAPAAGEQLIGSVKYMDFARDMCMLNGRDLTAAICVKHDGFRHENEVRAIMITEDDGPPGLRVAVDVSTLIETAVVGPRAPRLAQVAIEGFLRDYQIERPVVSSTAISREQ